MFCQSYQTHKGAVFDPKADIPEVVWGGRDELNWEVQNVPQVSNSALKNTSGYPSSYQIQEPQSLIRKETSQHYSGQYQHFPENVF